MCCVVLSAVTKSLKFIGHFDRRQRRKDFSSSLCVQTSCGAHPASCTVGTGVLSSGLKRGRDVTLTTPSSAEV
jgi:hypothetical protein